jgi:hypothetical protein
LERQLRRNLRTSQKTRSKHGNRFAMIPISCSCTGPFPGAGDVLHGAAHVLLDRQQGDARVGEPLQRAMTSSMMIGATPEER